MLFLGLANVKQVVGDATRPAHHWCTLFGRRPFGRGDDLRFWIPQNSDKTSGKRREIDEGRFDRCLNCENWTSQEIRSILHEIIILPWCGRDAGGGWGGPGALASHRCVGGLEHLICAQPQINKD